MIEGLENVTKADSCRSTKIDCNNAVEEYIKQEDWRIKANANTGYSSAGLVNNLAGKVIANYWLDKVYNKKEGDAHRSGDYHIHDLDILGAYCCGHDLQRLLKEGFNGVAGRVGSHAPKHVREALYQMANFIGILQSEWAGAQAFSSFDTFLSPYVFFDTVYGGLSEDDLKKAVRNFVYNLNVPSRWGQSPFSNVTLDLRCPNDLKKQLPMRGDEPMFVSISKEAEKNDNWKKMMDELRERMGSEADGLDDDTMLFNVNYSLFEPEIKKIAKAYYEVLNEGDAYGVPFTFPIPTINITEDFNWDDPDYEVIWENTAKYGSSYFQNFIGSQYMRDEDGNLTIRDENAYSPNDVRSMCCRLQLDKKQLRKRGGGLFGADAQTGSIGVVTINMARLGYLYKGKSIKLLIKRLYHLMDLAKSTLEKKRAVIKELNSRGLFPYTFRYVRSFDTFFSTIGINGMNECIRNFSDDKNDITDEMGQAMAMMIMEKIRERLLQYQEETGNLYNFEATPGEGCLRADTKVLTIDGPKPIGDLVDQKVPLLSFNRETKKLEYKSGNIFFDSVTSKVYRITFDNGYTLECTSEHPFAVRHWNGRDGEEMYWSPASSLKVGDRIKSVYTRFSQRGYKKYGKDFFEHREKWKFFNGEIPDGCVIHHKDFDKSNNDIDNLEMLTDKEHRIIHSDHLPKGPGFGENNHFFGKKHTEESRRKISEARSSLTDEEKLLIMEAYKHGLYANQIARMMNMTSQPLDYLSKCGFEARELSKYPAFNKRAILYLFSKGYNDREIVNILRGYNKLNEVRDVLLEFSDENHKVVSIEVLNKKMPVYNASVEDNQNFFVGDDEHGYVLTHNTTYRFAKEDLKRFPDIIQAGVPEAPYYTNSSQLPATFGEDVFDALDHQDELQKLYTGGTVLHIYSQEDLTGEQVKSLIRKVLSNYRLPYVSFTASFSTCPKHGRIPGLHQFCPLCDAEILAKHGNEEA